MIGVWVPMHFSLVEKTREKYFCDHFLEEEKEIENILRVWNGTCCTTENCCGAFFLTVEKFQALIELSSSEMLHEISNDISDHTEFVKQSVYLLSWSFRLIFSCSMFLAKIMIHEPGNFCLALPTQLNTFFLANMPNLHLFIHSWEWFSSIKKSSAEWGERFFKTNDHV